MPITSGKSTAELTTLALEALREQPRCSEIPYITVRELPDVPDGRNWEIYYVDSGPISIGYIVQAMDAVHDELGPLYHWVPEG